MLESLFIAFLNWLKGLLQTVWANWVDDKREEKEVDDIVEKIESPNLDEKLEGVEDAEDRLNRNS